MLNMIDIVLAVLILFYLLRNAGGLIKTALKLLWVIVGLVVYGIVVQTLLSSGVVSGEAEKTLKDSYFTKLSIGAIKTVYPAIEQSAPKVDSFIKDKIISAPTPEVQAPKITLPKMVLDAPNPLNKK